MRGAFALATLALTLAAGCGRLGFELAPAGTGGGGESGASGGAAGGPTGRGGTGGNAAGGSGGAAGAGAFAGSAGVAGMGGGAGGGGAGGRGGGAGAGGAAGRGGAAGIGGGGAGGIGSGGAGGSRPLDGGLACTTSSFGGHSYAFCATLSSWSEAETDCAAKGMRLARIDDAAENAWIQMTAFAGITSISSNFWFWIGATDQAAVGQWTWTDGTLFWIGGSNGTAQGGLYNNWVGGSPGTNASAGTCGIFQHAGFWQDWDCIKLQSYVCEQY